MKLINFKPGGENSIGFVHSFIAGFYAYVRSEAKRYGGRLFLVDFSHRVLLRAFQPQMPKAVDPPPTPSTPPAPAAPVPTPPLVHLEHGPRKTYVRPTAKGLQSHDPVERVSHTLMLLAEVCEAVHQGQNLKYVKLEKDWARVNLSELGRVFHFNHLIAYWYLDNISRLGQKLIQAVRLRGRTGLNAEGKAVRYNTIWVYMPHSVYRQIQRTPAQIDSLRLDIERLEHLKWFNKYRKPRKLTWVFPQCPAEVTTIINHFAGKLMPRVKARAKA